MVEDYLKARKSAEREYKAKVIAGEYPFLPALDEMVPGAGTLQSRRVGLLEIPVELIAGTKTRGRQNSFAVNFMPLMEPDTEFCMKWCNLFLAQTEEGFRDPIRVYEYLHRFYVLEGNKRVSVSKYLGMPTITADVTRLLPTQEVLARNPAYAEFLEFYKVAPIYGIVCSRPGAYREIAALAGYPFPARGSSEEPERWPEDRVRALQSAYWKFAKAMSDFQEKIPGLSMGDAFLVYLRIYAGDSLNDCSDKETERRVKRIRKELLTAHNEESVSLVESSDDVINGGADILSKAETILRPSTLIGRVVPALNRSVRNPLKAAFIYDRTPEDSNWIYDHEAGRLQLEEAYGGLVRTEVFLAGMPDGPDTSAETGRNWFASFDKAAEAAVSWGADVVFTTSPRQMTDTLRAAIAYKDVEFLNCSVNLAHQAVRTYYAKIYEAKFLAGIIAGTFSAADGTHRIGYCSDYPIYGTIAGINAFAIGASMTDPTVRIHLDWSSRRDNNWWWLMMDRGIHVISGIDSTHNKDGSNAYGLCYVEKSEPGKGTDLSGMWHVRNLAVPVWKWGRLYEIIVRSLLEGTYHARLVDRKDQATNYWWGMISGVVDLELSDDLPPYTRRLVEILRSDILSGSMNPFDGELRSQDGTVRRRADEPLTSMDIILMDWLHENVIGEIPEAAALTDTAREAVKVSGVKQA
ncbi:MAG: BMP family ABC transporter substrate-binding protein [Mogibacterium sp.]|nr:BMP family ABC transporter substrate-binding protein [Mogibacterium sp.]